MKQLLEAVRSSECAWPAELGRGLGGQQLPDWLASLRTVGCSAAVEALRGEDPSRPVELGAAIVAMGLDTSRHPSFAARLVGTTLERDGYRALRAAIKARPPAQADAARLVDFLSRQPEQPPERALEADRMATAAELVRLERDQPRQGVLVDFAREHEALDRILREAKDLIRLGPSERTPERLSQFDARVGKAADETTYAYNAASRFYLGQDAVEQTAAARQELLEALRR